MSQEDALYVRPVFQGATLKKLRERLRPKLSQRALAKRLGVQYQAVSNWETGKNNPSAELLPILAEALECEVDDLFKLTIPAPPRPRPEAIGDPSFLQELFEALLKEGVPRQSAEEARDLAAKLVAEARTPPDPSIDASQAAEALIRVRTLLRQRKS